jgi:ribulose 1,5-bisphosphate synthetase/thiazole synthase
MNLADKSSNMDIKENVIVDGILRYPSTGLDIIIVGAGLGGMMPAIECWRKGHEVQIIEKESALSTAGMLPLKAGLV